MKAISLVQPYRVELIDTPESRLGPEDVLVDVHYVGLCGSDLSAYRGVHPLVVYPRVPGHEIGGIIVAKGSQVPQRVEIGQPTVDGTKVLATVVAQEKGPKIRIFRYHPRKRYRRRAGHRQRYTRLLVDEIVV